MAKLDKRVLLVDTDPQGDLTKSLGWSNPDSLEITVANHIQAVIDGIDLQAREGILSHKEGIDLMPANIDLASMEMGIFMAMSREQILNTYIDLDRLIDESPLSGKQRAVVCLLMRGWSLQDIAEEYDKKIASVSRLFTRALEVMQKCHIQRWKQVVTGGDSTE